LTSKIKELNEKKTDSSDSLMAANLKLALIGNNRDQLKLNQTIESEYPNYYNHIYHSRRLGLADVQQRLQQGEVVVEYYQSEASFYAFYITNENIRAERIAIADIVSQVQEFNQIIQPEYFSANPDSAYSKYVQLSSNLYKQLLEKPLKLLSNNKDINKLYIIPDKSLNFLPFELLLQSKPENSRANYSNLDYLIKNYSISYGYSSSILFRDMERY